MIGVTAEDPRRMIGSVPPRPASRFHDQCASRGGWHDCRILTCSVLPVRFACNLSCPFCFSKSSLSALRRDTVDWERLEVERYFEFARERGANRLVITGGGEPLLRPETTVRIIERG